MSGTTTTPRRATSSGHPGRREAPTDASPHPPGVVTYVPVEDVAAAATRGVDAGGTLLVEPWELPGMGTMAVLGDPEGNRIGVWAAPM